MIDSVKKKCLNCGYERQSENESGVTPITECPKCHAIYENVEKWILKKERGKQPLKAAKQSRGENVFEDSQESRISRLVHVETLKKYKKIAMLALAFIVIGFTLVYIYNHLLGKNIDGEIFIVTKGGASIRLALVEVRIISKETAIEFVKLKEEENTRERQKLLTEANNVKSEIEAESDPFKQNLMGIYKITPLKAKLAYLESDNFFFEGIPQGIFKTKTDSDGKFTVRVKRGSPGVLFAHGSRLIGGETEEYYWFLPVKPVVDSAAKISLNNENLFRNALHDSQLTSKD